MSSPIRGGNPMPEPVHQLFGEPLGGGRPLGGWEPFGGFGKIPLWGDAADFTPIIDVDGQQYRLESQYNIDGYKLLRNLSGGASLGFADDDVVDHCRFRFDKTRD